MISIRKNAKTRTNRTTAMLATCGLLVFTVIQLPKRVDQWDVLQGKLAQQRELSQDVGGSDRTGALNEQLSFVKTELSSIRAAMVDGESMPRIQTELLEILRDSGCKLRKVGIQASAQGAWETGRKQEAEAVAEGDGSFDENEPAQLAFNLHTQQINASLSGTLGQVTLFLENLRNKPWMLRVAQIQFAQTADDEGLLAVELNIAFPSLSTSVSQGEHINWQRGSNAR